MGVSKLDYSSFYPVNILGRGVAVIAVPADSKYQTLAELLADIKANPGQVKMGSTGPGGLPSTIGALISNATDFEVTGIPFGGEGPGLTAMLGGEVDFMPAGISAAAEQVQGRQDAGARGGQPDLGRHPARRPADHRHDPGDRQVPAVGAVLRRVRAGRRAGRREGYTGPRPTPPPPRIRRSST